MLVQLMDRTDGWSRRRAAGTCLVAFAAVIAADGCTGAAFSVNFLYLMVCALAGWCMSQRSGIVLGVLAASAAASIKHYHVPLLLGHAMDPVAEVWNDMARLISFSLLVWIVSGLRGILLLDCWRAAHDGLTGVLNKTGFQEGATKAIARAQGRDDHLLLVFIDLDGFKRVNDVYGHSAGDMVLRAFASAASEAIRPTDLFARFGGDEFAALLTLPREIDTSAIAELLHERFTAILAQTGFDVTCSMGAAVMTGADASADAMMEEVDGLMYEVKRSGKNGLRLGRGAPLTRALRTAFPPMECDDLQSLLQRIDLADRGRNWAVRNAA